MPPPILALAGVAIYKKDPLTAAIAAATLFMPGELDDAAGKAFLKAETKLLGTGTIPEVKLLGSGMEGAKEVPWQNISGIVRDAAKGKGNFGLGIGSLDEAMTAGRSWVGDGFKTASDGKTMISSDGLRQFRPPSFKPKFCLAWSSMPQFTKGYQAPPRRARVFFRPSATLVGSQAEAPIR